LYFKKWRRGLRKDIVGQKAGNQHQSGYCFVKINGKLYAEHRLVWLMVFGKFPDGELDHKDLDKRNNCIDNLRPSTRKGNCSNRKGWSSSGYKGVYSTKRGKPWQASINIDGEMRNLGRFDDPKEAALAYDRAAIAEHGEFALLNFPMEDYK
jgi:hypothetical protein